MKTPNTPCMIFILSLLIGLSINGCSLYGTQDSLDTLVAVPEDDDSADFLDRVSEMSLVDMDNALHGLSLLMEGEDEQPDFASRVIALTEQKIVSPDWELTAEQPLTKGKLAYMIYHACDVKEKGVMLRLLGPTPRYCLRELQYHDMMARGDESMQVTGMEYVSVITSADFYKQNGVFPNKVGQLE